MSSGLSSLPTVILTLSSSSSDEDEEEDDDDNEDDDDAADNEQAEQANIEEVTWSCLIFNAARCLSIPSQF